MAKSLASNLIFTIWAVFGGFILHFLLSNYLTVLLKPSYEEPVETAADLIKRDLIPFYDPGGVIVSQFFAESTDPIYQEIAKRLYIAKDWDDYDDKAVKVVSTGLFAQIGTMPWDYEENYKYWYQSTDTIPGLGRYVGHLSNKKWPLIKVFFTLCPLMEIIFMNSLFRNTTLIF